jgi:hypothetical protein
MVSVTKFPSSYRAVAKGIAMKKLSIKIWCTSERLIPHIQKFHYYCTNKPYI